MILDDEDKLISDAIKDVKNPFYFVTDLMSNMVNLKDYKQEIDKVFKKFIKDLKPSCPIKIVVDTNVVKLSLGGSGIYDQLILLRPGRDVVYGLPGDQKMVIFFSEPFMENYVYYGFKNERCYRGWIRTIAKKYNLKQSKKDEFVYYI